MRHHHSDENIVDMKTSLLYSRQSSNPEEKTYNHHHFCWLVSMITCGETFPRDQLILPCFLLPTQPDIVNIFRELRKYL